MSGGTTSTVLRNLEPDKVYSVAVVPVYPDVEGIREQEKGKTSESPDLHLQGLQTCRVLHQGPSPLSGPGPQDSLEPSAEEHVFLVLDGSKNAMRSRPARLHLEVQLLRPQEPLHFQFPTCSRSCSSHAAQDRLRVT